MKKIFSHSILLVLGIFVSACSGQTEQSSGVRSVLFTRIQNSVQVRADAGSSFTQASVDQKLDIGNKVNTGEAGKARLEIRPDNTFIYIGSNTLVTLSELKTMNDSAYSRLNLESGNVWIVLGGGSLDVETPSGVASVRGSLMGVGYDGSITTVTCLEGHCDISTGDGTSNLIGGQACDLMLGDPTCQLRALSSDETQNWLNTVPETDSVILSSEPVEEQPGESQTPVLTATTTQIPTPAQAATQTPTWTASWTNTPGSLPSPITSPSVPLVGGNITVDSGSGHITRTSSIAAFYMSIHNNGATADTLIGASSGSCSGMGMQIMGIGPDGNDLPILVIIPAGSTAVLKFQGTRLLCYGVSGGIGPGSNVELTLVFENAGNVTTTIAIGNPPE